MDYNVDSAYAHLSPDLQRKAIMYAQQRIQTRLNDLDFKQMVTTDGDKLIRYHEIEWIAKITLALSCIIFFFIGAPLGAIIRKGGLGLPVLISVIVFIVYYIFDNTGNQMAKRGIWAVWFGKGLPVAVLVPVAVFFTYKANKDSVVFNMDAYRNVIRRFFGLRVKRPIYRKEVVLHDPEYARDLQTLLDINIDIQTYSQAHRLRRAPSWLKVFFKYEPDHEIERINDLLESTIDDLSNSRDRTIVNHLSAYPIVSVKAHTRPFERRWLNIMAVIVVPLGVVLYFRMWRYRLRLWRDLKVIRSENDIIANRIKEVAGL